MHLLQETRRFLRSEWLAPALHIGLFAITWLTYFIQNAPLFDGPSRWGFTSSSLLTCRFLWSPSPNSGMARCFMHFRYGASLGPCGGTSSVLG